MKPKPITAKDPRKRLVSDTFKALNKCRKVTNMREDELWFYGTCHKNHPTTPRKFKKLGVRKIRRSSMFSDEYNKEISGL